MGAAVGAAGATAVLRPDLLWEFLQKLRVQPDANQAFGARELDKLTSLVSMPS